MSVQFFQDLSISNLTLASLKKMGYKEPTEIQAKAIPLILQRKDLIAQAQTGTGKTAAFGIPIVEIINSKQRKIQTLILVPTRELAMQVTKEIKDIGRFKRIFVLAVYGGKSIQRQIEFLQKARDVVVVGTPGRIKDLINRGHLKLNHVRILVLDEADRMLDMGFIEDIREIISHLPEEKQNLLFSATMPKAVLNLAKEFLNPEFEIIKVNPEEIVIDRIKQMAYKIKTQNRFLKLVEILKEYGDIKTIIFTQTKKVADEVAYKLKNQGFKSSSIHGDFSQIKREKVLRDFKADEFKILVATDIAARGLDIKGVDLIINYEIPRDPDSYIHRIGRTGRAGKKGLAISIFSYAENKYFRNIQSRTQANIELIL